MKIVLDGTAEKYPAGQPAFSNRKIDFGATTTTTTTKAPLPGKGFIVSPLSLFIFRFFFRLNFPHANI